MKPGYYEEYTYAFHSPRIEQWIIGFLKSKRILGRTLLSLWTRLFSSYVKALLRQRRVVSWRGHIV
jgi:hypothetical protein